MYHMNPEFRSITSICVVEDPSKVPLGFTVHLKTNDTDADCDLWKDGFFKRVTRYVCISKTQGRPEHVLSDIRILQEKETPPPEYSVIQQTADSSQKPFKKKNLAFKLVHFKSNLESICDLTILYKLKLNDGYEHIGDISGLHFTVRKISAITRMQTPSNALPYGVLSPPGSVSSSMYPNLPNSMIDLSLNPTTAISQAPPMSTTPPSLSSMSMPYPSSYPYHNDLTMKSNASTMSTITGIEGVGFCLRDDLKSKPISNGRVLSYGKIPTRFKSKMDIEIEYSYDFGTERCALQDLFNHRDI